MTLYPLEWFEARTTPFRLGREQGEDWLVYELDPMEVFLRLYGEDCEDPVGFGRVYYVDAGSGCGALYRVLGPEERYRL